MSYSFPKNSPNGEEVILENGVTYKYNSIKKSWEILDSDVYATTTVSLNSGGSAKWSKGSLNESTLEGYIYFGIEQAGSASSSIGGGNVLYLNKLVDSDGALHEMKDYTPTDNSYCEVYSGNELVFKGQLKPSTYKVADRNPNDIVCDFSTNYALVSKGGSNWSGSSTYRLILTGMKINN